MRRLPALILLLAATACGGKSESSDRASAASAQPSAAAVSWDPKEITPAMIALGDSIFHGQVGAASCQACHGADAKQGTVAPVLTDAEWLHSDGSWEGIHNTIKSGVMSPKQFQSIMPPYGGFPMTLQQSRAVSAYVWSLSHKS